MYAQSRSESRGDCRVVPFTTEQFLKVFESYNEAIYPLQWVLSIAAIAAILLSIKPLSGSSRIIAGVLGLLWLWMGVAYHFLFFAGINRAAYLFGVLCLVQGIGFILAGAVKNVFHFRATRSLNGITGWVFVIFALFVYPLLGFKFGHVYPQSPTFGAPCPTTIFTFGILLWNQYRLSIYLVAIPFLWSLIGFSAALNLGIREDLALVVAGLLGTALITARNWRLSRAAAPQN